MPQQERARATRERILLAAADVIRQVGYANATLAGICAAAGVTKGALYFHFASKEDIARALVEEQHRISSRGAEAILAADRPPIETMMLMCADLGRDLMHDPIVRAGIRLTTDSSTLDPPVLDPYVDWMTVFGALAHRAQDAGAIRPDIDVDALARFIIPAYTGVQLVSEQFSGRSDLLGRLHEMWGILLRAILPPDALVDALRTADDVFG